MIAKHVAMKSLKKSDFSELVKYITDTQSKNERIGDINLTNCCSERIDAATLEIINTQQRNKRATSDKTYHLVLSFPSTESPDDKTLQAIENRICDGLGFGEHQRLSVVHHDTDNLHVHIAINKIHPTRYTIHEPYYGYKVLGEICKKLEQEYGLTQVNHTSKNTVSENRALDMELNTGTESFIHWIKRECLSQLQNARNWESFHEILHKNGMELRERGNGFVIVNQDGLMVKASSIARDFSKKNLEQKFGIFNKTTKNTAKESRKYEPKPISKINTTELYAKYKNEQNKLKVLRATELSNARETKIKLINIAKKKGKFKRSAIKIMAMPNTNKKILYSLTSKKLLEEINTINKQYKKNREIINNKYCQQQWADWLRSKAITGDKEALLALRARQNAKSLIGNTIEGTGDKIHQEININKDNITKTGNIIYKFGNSAIRDNGHKVKISKELNDECLEIALRLTMQRGTNITVNGTEEFKQKIVLIAVEKKLSINFNDKALEQQRQFLLNKNTQKIKVNIKSETKSRGI